VSGTRLLGALLVISGASTLAGQQAPAFWGAWAAPGRTPDLQRYSPLTEITRANVKQLTVAFEFSTGVLGPHEGNPLVVGDVMYVHTPAPNRVFALDLGRPGAPIRWTYAPPDSSSGPGTSWGVAYHPSGKVLVALAGGSLVALDAKTGAVAWRVQADSGPAAAASRTPVVVKDVVLLGTGGTEAGVRGRLTAYDVATGAERWRAYSTGPDSEVKLTPPANAAYPAMQGANLGATTWGPTTDRGRGAATNGWYAYDPELDLVYYGSGAPAPWAPDARPGDNKWSMTIWARHPADGRVAWAYQTTPHDEWGYEGTNEMILVDIMIAGQPVKALVHFDANGFAYTLDRRSGKLLRADPYGQVTWASGVDLATGVPTVNPAFATSDTQTTTGICPASVGMKTEAPAAYSPQTGWFYVPALNACMDYHGADARRASGEPFVGHGVSLYPGLGGNRGRLIAWDATAGKVKWTVSEPLPLGGGVLTTAGGLVFYGTLDGWFKALDQHSGAQLWRFKTAAGIVGSPISYLGPDGRQYIAVFSGVSPTSAADSNATLASLPSGAGPTNAGGVLTVFAVPAAPQPPPH
jgi:lanthanide-dependent methanol dehydrogenase